VVVPRSSSWTPTLRALFFKNKKVLLSFCLFVQLPVPLSVLFFFSASICSLLLLFLFFLFCVSYSTRKERSLCFFVAALIIFYLLKECVCWILSVAVSVLPVSRCTVSLPLIPFSLPYVLAGDDGKGGVVLRFF
jgi:hypothetical protein